ncbi:hypothetical protein ACFOLF_11410 [Paenibacillus sepulcri]|uniref:Flagellar hook-associated protein 2 C-terminal domain-containing protein n=1 Tax=Paenibacillus sepulcri TaxID=359917 RepID=A0ABS7CA88_9BACL|nr:hypothetical protein [Paenibacillus sepulcri]
MIDPVSSISRNQLYAVQPAIEADQYPFTYDGETSTYNRGGSFHNSRSFQIPPHAGKTMKHAADFASSWLRQSFELRAAANTLANKSTSAFEQRSVISTDPDAVTGQASFEASRASFEVQALAIAKPQRNTGYDLTRSAPSIVSAGTHTFVIAVDGRQRVIAVSVGTSSSNAASLGKIRDALNSAKFGITVLVREDTAEGTVRLEAEADKTGAEYSFSLTDLGGSAIAATGIGTVAVPGTNAEYRLNGDQPRNSHSNEILLQDGKASIQLRDTTKSPVKISIGYNEKAISEQLTALLNQANKLNSAYDDASDYLNKSLKQSVDQPLKEAASARIGIWQSATGEWKLNEKKLSAVIAGQPEEVRRIVTGLDGIAPRLAKSLARFEQLPADALLSPSSPEFQSFMAYQASMQSYLQLQMNGVLVNSTI